MPLPMGWPAVGRPARAVDKYSNRIGTNARRGASHDPERPTPGFYRIALRSGAPASAIRIWLGRPDGEEPTERPLLWQATLNGAAVDVFQYWPACAREPISQEEHDRIAQRNATQDPDSPFYDVRRPVDRLTAQLPF